MTLGSSTVSNRKPSSEAAAELVGDRFGRPREEAETLLIRHATAVDQPVEQIEGLLEDRATRGQILDSLRELL